MSTAEVSDDDFREILAQTRHFVRSAVVPREQEILADDRVPDDLREQAAKMGLFGYAIPQEWGGLGLNLAQDVEMAMELGYTSLALRSMFGTNNGIAGQVLESWLKQPLDSQLVETWKRYIRTIWPALSAHQREEVRQMGLERARAVAQAAGGFLGLGSPIS